MVIKRSSHRGRWWAALAPLAACAALAAGCGSDSGDSDSGGSSSGGEQVGLRVGGLAALTGDNAAVGRAYAESITLAADEINRVLAERGEDAKVEVTGVEDTQGQVANAIAGARKLVDINHVDAIVGDITSGPSIAVAQSVSVPKQIVQFTLGTSPAITELDDDGYFWRPRVSDFVQGPVMAQVLRDEIGADGKVNIAYHDDAYGQGLRDVFKQAWEQSGGRVGNEVSLSGKGTAYETEAQKLVQSDPDAWVMVIFCTDWGKLRGPLLRTGDWDPNRTIMADAAAYCVPPDTLEAGMGGTKSSVTGETFPAYEQLYRENVSGTPLQEEGGVAFDSVMLAFLAARAAGSSDPAKIKEKLIDISGAPGRRFNFQQLPEALDAIEAGEDIDYEGVTSGIDFDDAGDITSNFFFRWTADPKGGFRTVGERFRAEG
jgi:ABC-type branched-subunit amino acid transport system substrate-binding protein